MNKNPFFHSRQTKLEKENMCFYCRIQNGEIPLDPETYAIVAPLAAAVREATSNVPDTHYDMGFAMLRELAVKHDGLSVLPFIDAYLAYRADVSRRSSILNAKEGERISGEIHGTYSFAYIDKQDVSEREGEDLNRLEKEVTDLVVRINRLDGYKLKSLHRCLRSPRAAQIVAIIYEARNAIRALFANIH